MPSHLSENWLMPSCTGWFQEQISSMISQSN